MSCPPAVREQLEAVSGVKDCNIDYESKTATCTIEPGTEPEKVAAGLKGRFSGTVKR